MNVKKIDKNHMDFEKSINSFEIKKIGYQIIYWTILILIR